MTSKPNKNWYAVILAGGTGTRLWPISRENLPKQLQKLISDHTLLGETVHRLSGLLPLNHIYISTTKNYARQVASILQSFPKDNIIVEPVGRGTLAALALATSVIVRKDRSAVIVSIASDHAVTEIEKFHSALTCAFKHVSAHPEELCLVGIKPLRADTGLGYIKAKKRIPGLDETYRVEEFVEKPTIDLARSYVNAGNYYWNAAYYCFEGETLRSAYKSASPKTIEAVDRYLSSGDTSPFEQLDERRHEIEAIDHTRHPLALVIGEFFWSDIGNWHAMYHSLSKTRGLDVVVDGARHVDIGSNKNCLIVSKSERLIATVGLNNIVVIDTPDALLVMDKDKANETKELVEMLRQRGLNKFL